MEPEKRVLSNAFDTLPILGKMYKRVAYVKGTYSLIISYEWKGPTAVITYHIMNEHDILLERRSEHEYIFWDYHINQFHYIDNV